MIISPATWSLPLASFLFFRHHCLQRLRFWDGFLFWRRFLHNYIDNTSTVYSTYNVVRWSSNFISFYGGQVFYSRASPVVSQVDIKSSLVYKNTVFSIIKITIFLFHTPVVSSLQSFGRVPCLRIDSGSLD